MSFALHLETETVTHAHPDKPQIVGPETTISSAFDLLGGRSQSCVLICSEKGLEGIFTERDALRLMAAGADLEAPIETVMARKVVHVSVETTVKEAVTAMSSGGYRQLPILDADGKPVGVLKAAGVLHYLVEHFPQVIYTLPPEPHHNTEQREGA